MHLAISKILSVYSSAESPEKSIPASIPENSPKESLFSISSSLSDAVEYLAMISFSDALRGFASQGGVEGSTSSTLTTIRCDHNECSRNSIIEIMMTNISTTFF